MPQGSLQLIHSEISSTWEGEAGSEIPRSMAVIYVESQICLTSAPDRVRARQIDGIDGLCSIAAADQGTVPHRVQAKVVRCAPPVPLDGSLSLSSSMSQVPVLGKGDIHAGWEEEKQTVWGGGECKGKEEGRRETVCTCVCGGGGGEEGEKNKKKGGEI